jgi:nitrite reductase/ring-hydroxylating ferredoxin subunit
LSACGFALDEYDKAMDHGEPSSGVTEVSERRSFLAGFAAAVSAGLLVLFPFAAGWGVFTDPLRRRQRSANPENSIDASDFARICPLDALPADGTPREFVVTADVSDAWTRTMGQRVGSVFVARTDAEGKPQVRAFTATCPHLGCAVEFDSADERFECPCHESAFAKDGEKLFGPSLRGLDPLEVKLTGEGDTQEVWVAFQRFRAGIAERIPVG